MARHGIGRPLIVTDVDANGSDGFDRLLCALSVEVQPATFPVGTRTPQQDHDAAVAMFAASECDGVLGFGAMAALDLSRLVGGRAYPVITIPTGTETIGLGPLGGAAGAFPGRYARLPDAILCDATLTTGSSSATTAAAGMDALIHCLECYLSTAFNPPADGIALDGLRRAAFYLEAAVQNGSDVAARRELLAAALNAGLASEKGYGGIEAASHGLEQIAKSRHGVLHGALLSEMLTFNAPAVSDRFELIGKTLDLPPGADLAVGLADLAERVGLPLRLSEIGIDERILPRAARRAASDPANRTNPRHATAEDYERIMRAIL